MGYNKLRAMMIASLVFLAVNVSNAQTYAEIFRQKKTQLKYLAEQIAALKVYAGYLKKGYDIANTGLTTVRDFSRVEFNLHNSFIKSLKTVSPMIRNNSRVADIIILQLEIGKAFRNIGRDNLSTSTLVYLDEVRNALIEECEIDLEELLLVITSNKIEMKDDERLRRLDKIYENMLDKCAFAQSFCNQISLLRWQRKAEQQSIDQLRKYYEIN